MRKILLISALILTNSLFAKPKPTIRKIVDDTMVKVDYAAKYPIITAVKAAKATGDLQMLQRALSSQGLNINEADEDGYTPLIIACGKNSKRNIIELLVSKGANLELKNKHRCTALMECVGWDSDLPTVRFLVEKGASINGVDTDNNDLLMLSIYNNSKEEGLAILKYLVEEKNLPTNNKNIEGLTVLDHAREMEHQAAIRYLESRN